MAGCVKQKKIEINHPGEVMADSKVAVSFTQILY